MTQVDRHAPLSRCIVPRCKKFTNFYEQRKSAPGGAHVPHHPSRRPAWRRPARRRRDTAGARRAGVRRGRTAHDRQLRHLGRPAAGTTAHHRPVPAEQDHRAPHRDGKLDGLLAGARVPELPRHPGPAHGRQRLARQRPALHQQPRRLAHRGPQRQPLRTAARPDHGAGLTLQGPERPGHRHRERGHLPHRAAPGRPVEQPGRVLRVHLPAVRHPRRGDLRPQGLQPDRMPRLLLHDCLPELCAAVAAAL